MMNLKPYKILWWSIPVIFILIFIGLDSAFDLQLHDTYFVFTSLHIAILFALILGILGGIYWFLKHHKLIDVLSLILSIVTSLTLMGMTIIAILQTLYRTNNFEIFKTLNSIGVVFILILLLVQILLFVNITIGLFKGKKAS